MHFDEFNFLRSNEYFPFSQVNNLTTTQQLWYCFSQSYLYIISLKNIKEKQFCILITSFEKFLFISARIETSKLNLRIHIFKHFIGRKLPQDVSDLIYCTKYKIGFGTADPFWKFHCIWCWSVYANATWDNFPNVSTPYQNTITKKDTQNNYYCSL